MGKEYSCEDLSTEILDLGRGCAVNITGDPESRFEDIPDLETAFRAIEACLRLGKDAHNKYIAECSKVEKLRGALIWCGGSNDFAYPDGIARKGWEKTVIPLLADTD